MIVHGFNICLQLAWRPKWTQTFVCTKGIRPRATCLRDFGDGREGGHGGGTIKGRVAEPERYHLDTVLSQWRWGIEVKLFWSKEI